MSERKGGAVILIIVLAFLPHALRAQEESDYDWGQWTGIFMRFNPDKALDLSTEYQVRLGDNFRSLKSHYLEGMAQYEDRSEGANDYIIQGIGAYLGEWGVYRSL
jgi:hypothetical protein